MIAFISNFASRIRYIAYLLSAPSELVTYVLRCPSIGRFVSDEKAITILYQIRFGKKINLKNPKTFNEKVLWLTLNDRKNVYSKMVDKYEAKQFILDAIGGNLTPDTYQVCNSFDEIDFSNLPSRYVIKTTHDSGSVILVTEKSPLDLAKAKHVIERSLRNNYFWFSREWVYKNVLPRVIVEEYIETDNLFPTDYKFYCFNGRPKMCLVVSGRESKAKMNFVDLKYDKLPFSKKRYSPSDILPEQPACWDEMIQYAKELSKNVPFLRVDFFCDSKGKCLVGELTFVPSSGLIPFDNPKHDRLIGEWLDLSNK